MIVNQLAQNIRRLRVSRNWTQEFLAERAGITPTSVVHLETARTWLRPDMVSKLATALEVEEWELFAKPGKDGSISLITALERVVWSVRQVVNLPTELVTMLGRVSDESQVYVLRNTLVGILEDSKGNGNGGTLDHETQGEVRSKRTGHKKRK